MLEKKSNSVSFKLPKVLLSTFLISLLLSNASFAICLPFIGCTNPLEKAKQEIRQRTDVDPNNPGAVAQKVQNRVPVSLNNSSNAIYPNRSSGNTSPIPNATGRPTTLDGGASVSSDEFVSAVRGNQVVPLSREFDNFGPATNNHRLNPRQQEMYGGQPPKPGDPNFIGPVDTRSSAVSSNPPSINNPPKPGDPNFIGPVDNRRSAVSNNPPSMTNPPQPGDPDFIGPVDTRNSQAASSYSNSESTGRCGSKLYGGYLANCRPTKSSSGALAGIDFGGMFKNAAIAAAVDMAQRAIRGEKIDIGGTLRTLGAGLAGSLANQVAYNAAKEALGNVGASVLAGAVGSGVGTAIQGGNVTSAALGGAVGSGISAATGSSAIGAAAGGAATAAVSGGNVFSAAAQGAVNAAAQGLATDVYSKAHGQVPPVITTPTSNTLNTISKANPVPPSVPAVKVPVKYSGFPNSGTV